MGCEKSELSEERSEMDYLAIAKKAKTEFRKAQAAKPQISQPTASDISEGPIVAVKIASTVLGADIWLAFKDDFKPDDGEPLAVFYADEIPILAHKTPAQLRKIHKVKLAFGPGSRLRQ